MNFLRKKDDIIYRLASMQARIFAKSAEDKISSNSFIRSYMNDKEVKSIDDLSILTSGLSEKELYIDIKGSINNPNRGQIYPIDIMHWIGFFYRYASYLSGLSSKYLYKKIKPHYLYQVYPAYHGLDISKAVEMVFVDNEIEEITPLARFKTIYLNKENL